MVQARFVLDCMLCDDLWQVFVSRISILPANGWLCTNWIIKCSPSSPALENTGLNGLHKCVFCSFLVAYCSDLSYLHCTLAHLFIQIPMFNAFPYVLRMIRDSGCLIRCLYVFSYILFFTGFEIHSGFSCWWFSAVSGFHHEAPDFPAGAGKFLPGGDRSVLPLLCLKCLCGDWWFRPAVP